MVRFQQFPYINEIKGGSLIESRIYSVVLLLLLVARSKLVPDFAATIHVLHLIITSLYSRSIPRHWFWWALQVASASLMTFLGVWSCRWRELQPINFGGGGGPNRSVGKEDDTREVQEDDEIGSSKGKGRGRERDGLGEFEMIGMQDINETA